VDHHEQEFETASKSIRREESTALLARADVVLAAYERIAQSGRYPVRRLASAAARIETRAAALDRALVELRRETDRASRTMSIQPFRALHQAINRAVELLNANDAARVQPYCDDVIREVIAEVTALAYNPPPANHGRGLPKSASRRVEFMEPWADRARLYCEARGQLCVCVAARQTQPRRASSLVSCGRSDRAPLIFSL
jgi:hypothetical protein